MKLFKEEAACQPLDAVDLRHWTLTVTDTKNRKPLILPMTNFLHAILTDRLTARHGDSIPRPRQDGFLIEPKRPMKKVREASGVDFTLHDLRRTYISAYTLKRLVNHKLHNDVTAGLSSRTWSGCPNP